MLLVVCLQVESTSSSWSLPSVISGPFAVVCTVLCWDECFLNSSPIFFPDNFLPFVNAFDCYSQAGWYLERVISVSFRSWRKDTLSISRMQALLPISQKKYYICFGVSQKRKNKTRISLYPFLLLLPKYYYYYHEPRSHKSEIIIKTGSSFPLLPFWHWS